MNPPSSLLSASCLWHCGLPSSTTGKQTRKPDVRNSMSSCFSPQGTTVSMTKTIRSPPPPTSAPLPGIPACLQLHPSQFPFGNVDTKDTQASLLGSNFSNFSNFNVLSSLVSQPVSPPASPLPFRPCISLPTGPASGNFQELPPGPGCRMPTSTSIRAANPALLPLPSHLLEPQLQNNPSSSLQPEEWPTLPTPSLPSWSGWTKLLRSNYPSATRRPRAT